MSVLLKSSCMNGESTWRQISFRKSAPHLPNKNTARYHSLHLVTHRSVSNLYEDWGGKQLVQGPPVHLRPPRGHRTCLTP